MRKACPQSAGNRQKGLALVEFVIVMPLVALLLFATAEIGRAMYEYNTLTKSVRDGARYLAERAVGTSGVLVLSPVDELVAKNLVVYGNPGGEGDPLLEGLGIEDVSAAVEGERYVRVDAAYAFQPALSPLPDFGYGDGEGIAIGTFGASAVIRSLRQ